MKRTLLGSILVGLTLTASPLFAGGDEGLPAPPPNKLHPVAQTQEEEQPQTHEGEQPRTHEGEQPRHSCPQGASALPPIEGTYRLEGILRQPVQAVGGKVRVFLQGDQLRYERRSRLGTTGPAQLERGRVVRRGKTVFFRADPVQKGGNGAFQVLRGEDNGPASSRIPALAGYRPRGEGSWLGARREEGRPGREQLTPWTPRDGNHIQLLVDGDAAFKGMEAAIRGAKHSIDVQTFQWADDETGRRIAELLMQKAREGVRVRCLVDAASKTVNWMVSFHYPDPKVDISGQVYHGWRPYPLSFFHKGLDNELKQAGVQFIYGHGYLKGVGTSIVNAFRGIWNGMGRLFGKKPKPREDRGLSDHDHRKLMIVDERIGFCGGMNIASEYEYEWHDVVARVEGPAAYQLHTMFVDRWKAAGGKGQVEPEPKLWKSPDWCGDVKVEALGDIPGLNTALKDRYLKEIRAAKRRILIEVAYFLDDDIIKALGEAAQRGVRVVVIVPDDTVNDVYLVKESFAWVHNDVVRSGVELYFYQPRLNHSKVAAFDGLRCTVGSCNLDKMALELIAEANLWVDDARFTRQLEEKIFVKDLPQTKRAKLIKLKWTRKLRAGTLHLMRGWL